MALDMIERAHSRGEHVRHFRIRPACVPTYVSTSLSQLWLDPPAISRRHDTCNLIGISATEMVQLTVDYHYKSFWPLFELHDRLYLFANVNEMSE